MTKCVLSKAKSGEIGYTLVEERQSVLYFVLSAHQIIGAKVGIILMDMVKSRPVVAIFDAIPLLSQGIATLLTQASGYEVRPLALSDEAMVSLPPEFAPDVVLVDPDQVAVSPAETMKQLTGLTKPVAVVAYASTLDPRTVSACFNAGFRGFLSKASNLNVLQSAIDAVYSGGIYMDVAAAKLLVPGPTSQRPNQDEMLSAREKDVLRSVALGMSMKEIGSAMDLSAKTIETYKARASSKLNLQTRHDIVNFAIRKGWVQTHA